MYILWYIYLCLGIFIYDYVFILNFSLHIGSIYNVIATKRV